MAAGANQAAGRMQMQDYRTCIHFLNDEVWTTLVDSPTSTQLQRVEKLTRYLIYDLGLRHASEPTCAMIGAMVARYEQDPARQSALLQTVKACLKTHSLRAIQAGRSLPGNQYLEVLPGTFDELPEAVRNHFGLGAFSAIPVSVDAEAVASLARMYPLRSTKRQMALQRQLNQQAIGLGSMGVSPAGGSVAAAQAVMMLASMLPLQGMANQLAAQRSDGGLTNLQILNTAPAQAAPASAASGGLMRLLDRVDSTEVSVSAAPVAASQPSAALQPTSPQLAIMDQVARTGASSPAELLPETAMAARPAEQSSAAPLASPAVEPPQCSSEQQPPTSAAVEKSLEQDSLETAPSSVADAVSALAKAHYRAVLPAEGEEPLPPKRRGRPPLKRPASAAAQGSLTKKSDAAAAKSVSVAASASTGSVKKPAVSAKGKAMKKLHPSAKGSKGKDRFSKGGMKVTQAQRMKQRPDGCSRCRYTRGCCASCWKKRGYELI
jgi:hypothetical protein